MKPPIELYRPTLLNIIAIICYCLALLFHIIAYATDNWASLLLEGVRWRMGLWQGCKTVEGTELCTTLVFEDNAFQTGSDWHVGARVMMTLALILLFLLEFSLIAYACIKNLEMYRNRLIGITLGLSLSSAIFHLVALILYNASITSLPEVRVRGSFGLVILSILMEITLIILIYSERSHRRKKEKMTKIPASRATSGAQREEVTSPVKLQKEGYRLFTIDDKSSSVRTSLTSLSEAETFRKFAIADSNDINIDTSRSMYGIHSSRPSFSEGTGESLI